MKLPLQAAAPITFLAACVSSGVMTVDRHTYMIVKRHAQVGLRPPVPAPGAAMAYVYREVNAVCEARENRSRPSM